MPDRGLTWEQKRNRRKRGQADPRLYSNVPESNRTVRQLIDGFRNGAEPDPNDIHKRPEVTYGKPHTKIAD